MLSYRSQKLEVRGRRLKVCFLSFLFCLLFFSNTLANDSEILIAAASDMQFVMEDLIKAFESKYPEFKVKVSYGSSGNFFSQIKNGAPFHIFFSADMKYPEKLTSEGFTEGAKPVIYGVGRIVIWVSDNSSIDVKKMKFDSLLHPSIRKIAIANPEHAPYGTAAKESLLKAGIFEKVKDKLVFGENISQTAQFVQSGAADIGIIALSLAASSEMKGKGKYWLIPRKYHNPIIQGFVLLKRPEIASASSRTDKTAKLFEDFVKGKEGISILKRYGFSVP